MEMSGADTFELCGSDLCRLWIDRAFQFVTTPLGGNILPVFDWQYLENNFLPTLRFLLCKECNIEIAEIC